MNLNLKQKILASNLGISVVILLIGATIIYPTVKNILELRHDIGDIQTQLEERYEKTQKLKRSLKELSEIKTLANELQKTTAKNGDELAIITTFEKLAGQYRIDQNLDIAVMDETKGSGKDGAPKSARALPRYYRLSFLNNGLFADHLQYLQAIEKLPYYAIIDNLNFEKRQGEKDGAAFPLTLRFDVIIYVEAD